MRELHFLFEKKEIQFITSYCLSDGKTPNFIQLDVVVYRNVYFLLLKISFTFLFLSQHRYEE